MSTAHPCAAPAVRCRFLPARHRTPTTVSGEWLGSHDPWAKARRDDEVLVSRVMQHFDEGLLNLSLEERTKRPSDANSCQVPISAFAAISAFAVNVSFAVAVATVAGHAHRRSVGEFRGDRRSLVRIVEGSDCGFLVVHPPLQLADLVLKLVNNLAIEAIGGFTFSF
eukprot:CAMPEP_0170195546 /NCGR_PEP_ID=MMETSP0040_2-20121228/61745_1 /TAXON_ID=641309 /ORGANISM="Lotharella oceanica, Strain CCMP622" /LENGTH=166 /DNA_ID=CAMNT_0010444733 /DNA_START=727 /DNA_END=1225 /DNA_ORIENTATION=+